MESIQNKISESMKLFGDNLITNSILDYKILEQQIKIFYFSKFIIDYNDFYQIYIFIYNF